MGRDVEAGERDPSPLWRRAEVALPLGAAGVALLVRLLFLTWFPLELGDDGLGFARQADRILKGEPTHPPKYPLHMLLLVALRALTSGLEPQWSGRALSLVCSSAAVGVLAALGLRLTGSRTAAMAGSAFLAFLPWFLWASVSTSVEPLFILLVVAATALAVSGRDHAAVVVAGVSCLVRYEGFIVLMCITLPHLRRWRRPREQRLIALAAGAGLLALASILGLSYVFTGDSLGFLLLNMGATKTLAIYPERIAVRLLYPVAFYFLATPVVAYLAALGAILAWLRRLPGFGLLVLTTGSLWLFQATLMALEVTVTEMRYLMYGGVLLLVPAGLAAAELVSLLTQAATRHLRPWVRSVALLALVVMPVLVQVRMGYEICRRADQRLRAGLAVGASVAAMAEGPTTVVALRRHGSLIRLEFERRSLELSPVAMEFIEPGKEEQILLETGAEYLVFPRDSEIAAARYPLLGGKEQSVLGEAVEYIRMDEIPLEEVPAAHLAPGTYSRNASLIIYQIHPL